MTINVATGIWIPKISSGTKSSRQRRMLSRLIVFLIPYPLDNTSFVFVIGTMLPKPYKTASWYTPFMKNPRIYDVTISRPRALFRTTPQIHPKKIASGVAIIAASTMPFRPTTFQSLTKINPSCPAMAPRTMPKFSPIPAIMGTSSERTRNELRDRRISIS